ncbi:B-cell receptor CD22-like [Nelusetta ayraudi]|uniref:B-cell receptor CD22-like n=1 Tax=Nelusetta ayraudi TaxID=303726 RepID=UPI003F72E4E7
MSLKASCGLVVILLSVEVMHAGNDFRVTYSPTYACAVKGSRVLLFCRYNSSRLQGQNVIWVVGSGSGDLKADLQYSGRVKYTYNQTGCLLEISDLRESDSAEYKCRVTTNPPDVQWTGSPGVILSVTDLQLKKSSSLYWTLECASRCRPSGPNSYIWYNNGKKIPLLTSSTLSGYYNYVGSFYCAVEGQEKFVSLPLCVAGPESCNKVTYDVRNICATEGSSVNIYCSYSSYYSVTSTFWFRGGQQWTSSSAAGFQDRVQVQETEQGRSRLRIDDLTKSDSAEYRFKFSNYLLIWGSDLPGTTLTVTALQIEVITATTGQFGVEVELMCHSDCTPASRPTFIWFKNDSRFEGAQTCFYKGWISPGEAVSCSLAGHEDHRSPPVYAPRTPSVSVAPSAVLLKGNSLTLTCSSDANPEANYTWYKEDEVSPLASGQSLTIRDLRAEHSGYYYCVAQNAIGLVNSTSHLVAVAGFKTSVIIGPLVAVFLLLVFIAVFLLVRRKLFSKHSVDQAVSRTQVKMISVCDKEQDDLCYTSVTFIKIQEDSLYSNIRLTQPELSRQNQDLDQENDSVEYSIVRVKSSYPLSGRDEGDEDSALYSTVRK